MAPKKEEKGGFDINGKKLDVGPNWGFDQGSAYDSMNSEMTGKDKTGSGNYGGKYERNSESLDGKDYTNFKDEDDR